MTVRALILAACAVLLTAAAQAPAQAPAKPAPKAAATAAPFDAQDPASLIALLATMDAKAEKTGKTDDGVLMRVTTPTFGFGAQFAACDAQGRRCKAMAFTTSSASFTPTLVQLNGFNQTSITCKVWQDKAGKPNIMYSALLSPRDTAEAMRAHVGAWQGCLANFGDFLKDPAAYLASAP